MKDALKHLSPDVHAYVLENSLRMPPCLDELMAATQDQTDSPVMATVPEQGQFLAFLIASLGAKRILEIGVFTGVGTLWMASAAGPDSQVIGCDVSEEYASIGMPYWAKAGVSDRIELRIGPATETLDQLAFEQRGEGFDFCYVDADKESYGEYYEKVLKIMRPGGVIVFDNMLLNGQVADRAKNDEKVTAIRALNSKLHVDNRVDVSFLPICDGVYLARKR